MKSHAVTLFKWGFRKHLENILQRKGPFCDETFTRGNVEELLGRYKIL